MVIPQGKKLTIPNAISLAGFFLVIAGASIIDTRVGVGLIMIGRLFDLVDGFVARKINQASDFGAAFDTTLDKLSGLVIVSAGIIAGTISGFVGASVLGINLAIAITAMISMAKHPKVHFQAIRMGKYAMAAQNIGLTALLFEAILIDGSKPQRSLLLIGDTFIVLGVYILGFLALNRYILRAYRLRDAKHEDELHV